MVWTIFRRHETHEFFVNLLFDAVKFGCLLRFNNTSAINLSKNEQAVACEQVAARLKIYCATE